MIATSHDRKLSLRKETLRELSAHELVEVAGGVVQSIVPTRCNCTGFYPSLNAPCTPQLSSTCTLTL